MPEYQSFVKFENWLSIADAKEFPLNGLLEHILANRLNCENSVL